MPVLSPSHVGPIPWSSDAQLPEYRSLPDLLDGRARDQPDHTAVRFNGQCTTYAELRDSSLAVAKVLRSLGVAPGTPVALMADNSTKWLEVAFGILRCGAQLHAFSTWSRAYDLHHLLSASQIHVLVMEPKVGSTDLLAELLSLVDDVHPSGAVISQNRNYPSLRNVVLLDSGFDATVQMASKQFCTSDREELTQNQMGARPVVFYTSGSTRHPKAVPLEQDAMIVNGYAIGSRMHLRSNDRVWLGSPLFWSMGLANAAMATFVNGAELVLQRRFTAEATLATLRTERCTAAYLLPTMVAALCDSVAAEIKQLTSLRTGITIGRPDEVAKVIEVLGIRQICNVYGSTEVYGNCCVTDADLSPDIRTVTQGLPLPGFEVRITSELTGNVIQRGEVGDIQVRGRVMAGYIDAEELTHEVETADGWYRTGDTGRLRPDGMLEFVSRRSEMIKTSGINVSPLEVETFVERCPGVRGVAVVGAPHPVKGQVVVAFVEGEGLVELDVISFCKGAIADYNVPYRVVVVERLPLTATGKLARKELLDLAQATVSMPTEPIRPD
ncbi:MAG: 3-[(3aS,4S,7aS)-7a-methyl-1,5-dioxo-octahydro-1H-inden-4-yl]propanoyl:CoA ligase [Nitrospira sp.]|nr:3-[(3aS,4S,7aS)-7a-methyl-1,5-dioxo-octahydro-1H-inden-4-yl]propanoyl:CoA ligase [Nitrospira sp.]